MTTFALRGNTEKKIHGSHSDTKIECRGTFRMSGPQPISALPVWLVKLFEENPEVVQISVSTEATGVVYQRMPEPTPPTATPEPYVLRGWGYGFIPDAADNSQTISWYPCCTTGERLVAIKECRRELTYLGRPLFVQVWEENADGVRNPVGVKEFLGATGRETK